VNRVICGDSAEVLKTFEADCIDLTVTSPPYDNLRTYNGFVFDFETIARELYRVTKPGGVVVWVVGDATIDGSETLTSFKQALYFRGLGFNAETMVYEIAGTGAKGSNYYYWQSFEYMFVFSKGQPKTSNRIADIKNSMAGKRRGFRTKAAQLGSRVDRQNVIAPDYSVRPNVWRYGVGQDETFGHPAPFPEALARDHILSWSNPGDLVLDPFAGSGTTLKMAKETGRNYIGIEISADYCKLIERRIAGANVPLPFFSQAQS
jgi:DNA modification methylase